MCLLELCILSMWHYAMCYCRPDRKVQRFMRSEGSTRPDRRVQRYMRLEGSTRPDQRVHWATPNQRVQRATGLEGPAETHAPEGPTEYSLEWRICCMWYFRELTKHLCLPCYVICVLGNIEDRRKALAWFVQNGRRLCFKILGYVLLCLKNDKLFWKFRSLQVGIRALVWGIRIHLQAYLDSNWGFEKSFQKKRFFQNE